MVAALGAPGAGKTAVLDRSQTAHSSPDAYDEV